MTDVLEARAAYNQARADARAMVDVARALLGRSIVQARRQGRTQSQVMAAMNLSREQVRAFEKAYQDWLKDHNGQEPAAA